VTLSVALVCVALVASVWLVCRAAVARASMLRDAAHVTLSEETEARVLACEAQVRALRSTVQEQGNALAMRGGMKSR